MRVRIESTELENVLGDLRGLLDVLHQEELAGLQSTSLRIEINAVESIQRKLFQMIKQSIH